MIPSRTPSPIAPTAIDRAEGGQPAALVGRENESARLRRDLLTATAAGASGGVVVTGAAGIGKTALIDHVTATLTAHRVLRVRGVPAEADLAYSALHLLCSVLATELTRLEPHQREALETVVALRAGPAPERFVVRVAVVELLARAAEKQPVLCVVDDFQWIDAASAEVLAFAVERVEQLPVGFLFGDRGEHFPGLAHLVLDGLRHTDACRLLASALPAPLDDPVLTRVASEARGNPRALLDFAQAATPAELAGGYGLVTRPGAPAATELDADSGWLLLLAAAEPLGDPARLWRAAARLGIPASAADGLAGLVSFGVSVRFRDPVLRWSVYGAASAPDRRRVHEALAHATCPQTEPDRHVWHRAHALAGPAADVADELARTASTARRRGGLPAEAAFLEHAALTTVDSALRVDRALRAAAVHHAAGAPDAAARLLATAALGPLDAAGAARLKHLRSRIAFDAGRTRGSVADLLEAAQDWEAHHPRSARPVYLEALAAATFTGHLDAAHTVLSRLATHQPRGTDRLLEGVALRCTAGYAAAVEPLKLALKTLDADHEHDHRARLLACLVAADLWDDDAWHELTGAELARTRAVGARANLPYVLTHRALVEIHLGRFGHASALIREARATSEAVGSAEFSHAADVLAGWRGDPGLAPDLVARGEGMAQVLARYAKAVLGNGLGHYDDAVAATRDALEGDGLGLHGWSLAELVEGATRAGERDLAAAALDRLSERAFLSGTEWALGLEARSRALLHDGPAAEALYAEAVERLGRSRIATHTARAQLVYGEWLRRQGRRIDARHSLRAAHESFLAMGAGAFAARAMRELLATGERARRRVPETEGELTPQERRIATLASEGRSNPEIATTLSISPRTVEYHLHKVFTKLSISSRTELHLVLTAGEDR